jgi:hypothetical protein
MAFKINGYRVVINEKKNNTLTTDKDCKFAHWLNESGKKTLSHLNSYHKIESSHKKTYDNINSAIKFVNTNTHTQNYDKIIKHLEEAETSSHNLFGILTSLEHEHKESTKKISNSSKVKEYA